MIKENSEKITFKGMLLRITKSSSFTIFLVLFGMCVVLAFAAPVFLTSKNVLTVARSFSYIAIMAIGEGMVILIGGIDLSVGSVLGLGGTITALSMTSLGIPVFPSILLGIAGCVLVGAINGFFVIKFKLPPFIATLGMLSIARSACHILSGSYPILNMPTSYLFLGQGYIAGIPFPVWLMVIIAVIISIFLNKTVTGRRIYAVGGNEQATRFSGVNTNKIKLLVYILSAGLAGFAGIVLTAKMGAGQSSTGTAYELDAIGAVIIGGASMSGGSGTVFGTVIGAAIMGVIKNALVLLSVDTFWQQLITGVIIIVAVSLDQFRKSSMQRAL